jgi:spore coat protein A, manganese oxidase
MLKRRLQPFVDQLPILKTLKPIKKDKNSTFYIVRMKEFYQKLHRDLPATRLWGYEGQYPGPTIEVEKNEKVNVLWANHLPERHFLPVDKTIHGANKGAPEVRTVVHVHGGTTPASSDGHPDAWFTRGFKQKGPQFKRKVYHYPNQQDATTLWYHDHALGITRLNIYAGLAGFYLVRDRHERSLSLPKGKYEIPLIIQDRSFHEDGSLFYPSKPQPASPKLPTPSIVPDFFGNFILVNGKVWPYLEVEPRKYRFRLLNASNERSYTFSLSSGQPFFQIGTDGGFLQAPILVKQITLFPAERVDVIIDFSAHKGQQIILRNTGANANPKTTGLVMQFRVSLPLSGKDESTIPSRLKTIHRFPLNRVQKIRNLTLVEKKDRYGRPLVLLNNKRWDAPATETPRLGNIELWNLINLTVDTHPIHIHLIDFFILNRQPFDVQHFKRSGKIRFTGPPVPPAPYERGRKDTVRAESGKVTRIITTRFGPYTGNYVWHCHILEHEDNEMMRPLIVKPK